MQATKNKKSFVLYTDSLDVLSELTDKQIANIFRAIVAYQHGEIYPLEPIEKVTFIPIRNYLDRDFAKWEDIRKRRAQYGKLGGVAKASKSQHKVAKAGKRVANVAVSVNGNVSGSVNDNVNIISTNVDSASHGKPDINECVSFFQEQLDCPLDGSEKENRRYCSLLLNKLRKGYPDRDPVELVKLLIAAGLQDSFHGKNVTSFKYIYYHIGQIIQAAKQINSQVIKL